MVEIRVKRMCRTPPYNRADVRGQLTADLRGLGVPRLEAEVALAEKRPNLPLDGLTAAQVQRLLSLVDRWIEDARAHAGEPETAEET